MGSRLTQAISGTSLRAICVAAALACGASAAIAGTATVNVTSFSVSTADFSGAFVWTGDDPFQSYNLSALEAGGLLGNGSDNFSANNWNLGLNRVAQTSNTFATGNTVQFTDAMTSLTTAGFNLSSQATGAHSPPLLPNSANASATQSGSFFLIDENGASIGGTITFDLFYNMAVSAPGSTPSNYSQTSLSFLSSTDSILSSTFADGLVSNSLASGVGSIISGHYTKTYTLTAGEAAYYALSGSAIAFADIPVAAVPEPETYAMMVLGLAGIGAAARRRKAKAAARATAA